MEHSRGYQPLLSSEEQQDAKELEQLPPVSPPQYSVESPPQFPAHPAQCPSYTPASASFASDQQLSSNNVVVVGQQPVQAQPVAQVNAPPSQPHNKHLAVAVVCTVCSAFFPILWPSLFCLIPAIVLSASEVDSLSSNDRRQRRRRAALGLNIAAIIYNTLAVIAGIIDGVIAIAIYFQNQ